MNKIFTILKREYKESVYKKSFLITTLITPVLMLAMVFLPAILTGVNVEETMDIKVIDYSNWIFDELVEKMDTKLSDGSQKYNLTQIPHADKAFENLKESLKQEINDEQINGFIHIPADVVDSAKVEFYAKNVGNFDVNREIRNAVNEIVIDYRISKSGLEADLVNELTKRVSLKTEKIRKGEEEKEGGFAQEYFSTIGFVMILYITIILYGATIMRGVIQEKNSRIIEILLSSANSFQLMLGKVVGLGSVGLTQYLIWSVFGILLMLYGGGVSGFSSDWFNFSPMIFVYFVLFFILGYFLFATLYAGIGSITNSDQEAQQLSFPVVMLLVVPLLLMTFIIKNPDSTLAVVLSLIPFFSPILMFTRINITEPSMLEIWGAILLLILTILGFIWVVAKIYRVGILMYGKKPNLPEVMRWIRAK